ncbi:MAG: tetratricopeptide repeat protein [Sulfurifustis sp.]
MDQTKRRLQEAYALAKKGDYEEALRLCHEVVRDHPEQPEPLRTQADIYGHMGDYARESEVLGRVIAMGSMEPCDYYALGQAELLAGGLDNAVQALTKAIDLGNEHKNFYYSSVSHFLRAEAFVRMNKYREALADCEQLKEDFRYYLPSGMKTREEIVRQAKAELAKASVKKKWSFRN